MNALRGWGRGLRNAVGRWYVDQEADKLAYQVVKYQQRDGWSHGDLLRLAHPKAPSAEHEAVFRWMLSGAEGLGERKLSARSAVKTVWQSMPRPASCRSSLKPSRRPRRLRARAKSLSLIDDFDLPREAIPTQWLNEVAVWDALLQRMPITALVRNLGKMTAIGLVKPFSEAAGLVVRKLRRRSPAQARPHPPAGGVNRPEGVCPRPR